MKPYPYAVCTLVQEKTRQTNLSWWNFKPRGTAASRAFFSRNRADEKKKNNGKEYEPGKLQTYGNGLRRYFQGNVQNMDERSLDPLRGPGPRTGSIIVDRIHSITNMAVSDTRITMLAVPRKITEILFGPRRWLIDVLLGSSVLCKSVHFFQDIGVSILSLSAIAILTGIEESCSPCVNSLGSRRNSVKSSYRQYGK